MIYPQLDSPTDNAKNNAVLLQILGYLATQENKILSQRFLVGEINVMLERSQLPVMHDLTEYTLKNYHNINLKAINSIPGWKYDLLNNWVWERDSNVTFAIKAIALFLTSAALIVISILLFTSLASPPGAAVGAGILLPVSVIFGGCFAYLISKRFYFDQFPTRKKTTLDSYSDQVKFFEHKKKSLNKLLERETSDDALSLETSSVGIVKNIEYSMVRCAILTHYHWNIYQTFSSYSKGHGWLCNTPISTEPTIDVKLLSQDIQKIHKIKHE
jgi:hypothetical protein